MMPNIPDTLMALAHKNETFTPTQAVHGFEADGLWRVYRYQTHGAWCQFVCTRVTFPWVDPSETATLEYDGVKPLSLVRETRYRHRHP